MAIRTIEWTVQEDGMSLSPTVCQDGGVQGDHNKTRAEFVLPASLIEGYEFYVEYVDTFGGFDTTEQLTVEGDRVGVLLPLAWTQHGGEATLRLVATKEGETGYTLEGKVRYHSRVGLIEKVKALIDGCIQAMLTRTEKAADRIETAEAALTDGEERVEMAVKTATAAKSAAEQALEDAQEAEKRAASVVGVYVGSGDMPDGYRIQIDPVGETFDEDDFVQAGYGLGTKKPEKVVYTPEEIDTLTETGWYGVDLKEYRANGGDMSSLDIDFAYATVHVVAVDAWTFYQELYIHPANTQCVNRRWYYNLTGYSPWEHTNPPMAVGVEYRTTERFLGQPVYTKLFSVPAEVSSIDAGIGENVVSSVVELRGMYIESGVWVDWDNNGIFYDKAFLNYVPLLDTITLGYSVPTGASGYIVMKYTKS